ncbi:MAG: bifunctional UDP-sugar hydrolase/5'-nucleotidase [Saprospiraceae bacterium]
MKMLKPFALLLVALAFFACKTAQKPAGDDGVIEIQFLQMNDVYEISPLGDGTGGLARVATIRKELLAKNPNTYTVLAGDFISPSVLGTLRYEGKRIRGRHMVDVLNTLGLDWVVFGNHEFDYDDLADLQARLDESNFVWFAANARLKGSTWTQQFFKNKSGGGTEICPDNQVFTMKDADGTTINLGVFGVLINSGVKSWVEYSDWFEAAKKNFAELNPKTDFVIALTHLDAADDKKISAMLPEIPLIMGGHEHDNQIYKIGKATVAKADANAKTVYVHTLRYDKKTKSATVKSELRRVDASIPDDPATAAVVNKWLKIRDESLASSGFESSKIVANLPEPLDCREVVVRHTQCKAGEIITSAMFAAAKTNPDCALVNSGSIRVDDILKSPLTEFDIVRMLPFGGGISEVEMRGSLLRRTLEASLANKGKGGYLQLKSIRQDASGKWLVNEKPLDDAKFYRVVIGDFLLTGNEQKMEFLKASLDADGKSSNPDILKISKPDPNDKGDVRNDIRHAVIRYLKEK